MSVCRAVRWSAIRYYRLAMPCVSWTRIHQHDGVAPGVLNALASLLASWRAWHGGQRNSPIRKSLPREKEPYPKLWLP